MIVFILIANFNILWLTPFSRLFKFSNFSLKSLPDCDHTGISLEDVFCLVWSSSQEAKTTIEKN